VKFTSLLAGASLLALTGSASATTFHYTALSGTASDTQIQTYMNGQLSGGQSVTVTGAVGSAVFLDSFPNGGYTADGHVVGANPGSTSYTLLNLDGGTFIMTNPGTTNQIAMTFAQPIGSVSFDFEIFPDQSCPSANNCGQSGANVPDLTLQTFTGAVLTSSFEWVGVVPGGQGSFNAAWVNSPAGSATTGHNPETAPQLLGSSGTLTLPSGTTEIVFQDWPAAIGIANLNVGDPPPVSEPRSLAILGSGLVLFGLVGFTRRRAGDIFVS
jgi:hypothetical protein